MGQGRVNQLGGVFINGRPLPLHIRQKIVEMAKDGIKPCQISRELRVSHGCVSKILYRYAETGSIEPGQHQINKNGLKKSHKTPLQVKQSILAVSKAFPDLKPFQIREILISRNLVPKTSIPTLNQISEILGTPKIKHSVKDILKDHEEDSYNILEESAGDQRRVRTSFSTDQLTILERAFLMNNYPDAFQREQIGLQTGLCDSRIQVWFSNRRARSRKHMVFSGMNLNNSLNLGLQKSENLNFQNSEKFSLQIPQNLGLQKSENLDLQKSQIQLPVNLPSVFPGIGTSLNHVLYPQAFTNILFQIQLNSMKNMKLPEG
ncbi:hypothetical protein FO519_007539 [Halicephalobus sp. NKZ332]|nr:hypothetical protein FO519_007539 [Halicephalobus sp. NKZ332]